MADDQTEATAVLWEQARAGQDQQGASADALRTRAIALLSVSALVAGLFGSRLPHPQHSLTTVAALVAALGLFAGSIILAVMIAWPRTWYDGAYLDALISQVADGTATLAQVNLSLATITEANSAQNQGTLTRMYGLFAVLCLFVGLQVAAWAIAVL